MIQECETRFGTTCDAIERFLKALPIVAELGSEEINKHLLDLSRVTADDGSTSFSRVVDQDGSITYPSLRAIANCFKPIRHVQTSMAVSYTHLTLPTILLV